MDHSYIDVKSSGDNVFVWGRNTDGQLIEETLPISDFLYAYMPDNTGIENPVTRDLYGNPVKRVDFSDRWDFKEWCKKRTDILESDIQIEYKVINDYFRNAPTEAPLNTMFYDIEVDFDLEDGLGYPLPSNPFGEINMMQCFDCTNKKYVILMPEHLRNTVTLTDDEFPVDILWCSNEREMLLTFSDVIDDVDVLCGWYTNGFDLPYIMARAIINFGEDKAMRMFCRGGFPSKKRDFIDEYGVEKTEWTLVGRQHTDMMELYKKFFPSERASFSLGSICQEDLGETKDEYEGDLGELYRENPQAWANYGKKDVRLLYLLDKKHQIMRLAFALSRMSRVFVRDVTGSVKPIEMGFLDFCHERGVILPDKKQTEAENFPGAIVYDTVEGKKGKMFTIDLTALYPKTMIMLGLSTETYIYQLSGYYDDYVRVMMREDVYVDVENIITGERESILASDLEQIIRDSGWTISANGSIFNGELGLLSAYVEDRFAMRKKYQLMKADAYAAGDKENADVYDLYQKVFKIVCNSLYGCISNAHFRLFDINLAKSITLTGQIISKWQAYKANKFVHDIQD